MTSVVVPSRAGSSRTVVLFWHLAVLIALWLLYPLLPEYHQGNLTRVLVLAIFASGYNLLFGYTGLLSLGHALYFGAGVYGAGLSVEWLHFSAPMALLCGVVSALIVSLVVGALALRTRGVAFMIVTLMFAQAGYLTVILLNSWTRGDEGFIVSARALPFELNLGSADTRFQVAWLFHAMALMLVAWLCSGRFGALWQAIRENEDRVALLGYRVYLNKLCVFVLSGVLAGLSGALYALLFGYVGASLASIQYSILVLLWVLVGGHGVVLGPLLGTALMFWLGDTLSGIFSAWLLVMGLVLIVLVLLAPRGLLGSLRHRLGWRGWP